MTGLTEAGAKLVGETMEWQRQRIAELEAALRPFAGLADEIEQVAREAQTDEANVAVHVSYADAVAARSALNAR